MAENNPLANKAPIGRPNIYVQSLTFNDGTPLSVNKNDIVVFVGPNNVGKSQTLRDIESLSISSTKTVTLNEVSFTTDCGFPFEQWLEHIGLKHINEIGHRSYSFFDFSINQFQVERAKKATRPDELAQAIICHLNTEERLSRANPPDSVNRNETPRHPIHLLCTHKGFRRSISTWFQRAFDVPVFPFERFGRTTPLVLGDYPVLSKDYPNEIEREEAVADIVCRYPHLEKQGDGMRSFVGLMLYLIIDHYNTFLIDEPESFLHPPQARLMGEIVGELLSNEQQAFISTHSTPFIQGLLEKCPERVKVVRITRSGDTNTFSVLNNIRLLELSKDPFLKYSNLLDGLFYKNVVLCESDADCMFYSMVNGALDMKGPKGADTLFIHCGGKHRMSSVAQDLRDLHIDFRVVPDFDIFNNEDILKKLIEACGGSWSVFEKDFKMLSSSIQQRVKNDTTGRTLLDAISIVLSDISDGSVSNSKKTKIRNLLDETKNEWDRLKETGVSGVGSGDTTDACNRLLNRLKTIGIHVVDCGELERFIPDCGGHGPIWIQNVLDKHSDISGDAFKGAKDFVRSWNL